MDKTDLALYKKKARKEGAIIVFVDESGFSLIPLVGKTWGIRGQTPIIRHRFNWPKLSAISAVTTNPHIYMKLLPNKTVRSEQIKKFLAHLLKCIPGKIFVVWDRISTHRSKIVKKYIKEHKDRLNIYFLPAYAPELNADEGVWNYIKWHELSNFCANDIDELKEAISKSVQKIRNRPKLIKSFFNQTPLFFNFLSTN